MRPARAADTAAAPDASASTVGHATRNAATVTVPGALATPDALRVFYDGECGLCSGAVAWALARDRDRALVAIPYQSPEAQACLGPERAAAAAASLHVWSASRGVRTGSDAIAELLLRLPGWRFAGHMLASPLLRPLAAPLYRAVAARRAWFGAARCPLPPRR